MGRLAVIPVRGFNLKRKFYAVYQRGRYISNATRAFLTLIGPRRN